MLALIVLAFLFVLVRSLSTGYNSFSDGDQSDQFANVFQGTTQMRRLNGQRVWVSRLSPQQSKQLFDRTINSGAGIAACDIHAELCVVDAATTRSGIELRYLLQRPTRIAHDVIWVGGFIDPNNGNLYDLLGRSYGAHKPLPRVVSDGN